jgi:hypothetical protein
MSVCARCASHIPSFDICKWHFTLSWRCSRQYVSLYIRVPSFELVNVFGHAYYVTGTRANVTVFSLLQSVITT